MCLGCDENLDFSISTGPQGDQGIQGLKGDKGDKGDQGDPGTPGADGNDATGIDGVDGTVGGFTIEYNSTIFNATPYANVNHVIQSTATKYNDTGTFEWWFSDYDSYSNDINYTQGTFYDAIAAANFDKIYIKLFDTSDASKMELFEATNPTIENSGDLRVDMTLLGGNINWTTSINKIGVTFTFVKNGTDGTDGSAGFNSWNNIILENDWVGENEVSPQYCKNNADLGLLRGGIYKDFVTNEINDLIGTLPANYRPSRYQRFPVYWKRTGAIIESMANNGFMTVSLDTNGELRLLQATGSLKGRFTLDLSSITYRIEL